MNFVTRILATSVATASLGLAIGAAATPPAEAAGVSKPKIETVYPEKAPSKSGKGGFALPFVERRTAGTMTGSARPQPSTPRRTNRHKQDEQRAGTVSTRARFA